MVASEKLENSQWAQDGRYLGTLWARPIGVIFN